MEMINKIAFAALLAAVAVTAVMGQDAPSPSPMSDSASAAGSEASAAAGSAASAVGSAATPGAAASAAAFTSLPALSSVFGAVLISFIAHFLH